MEIKQIIITVRGSKGEALKSVLDASGQLISGTQDALNAAQSVLKGPSRSTAAPTGPGVVTGRAVLESENEVTEAQPSENEVEGL